MQEKSLAAVRLRRFIEGVSEFHRTFGVTNYRFFEDVGTETSRLRYNLIQEEWKEYEAAETRVEIIDALTDLLYVTVGTAISMSIELKPIMLTARAAKSATTAKYPIINEVARVSLELCNYQLCKKGLTSSLNSLYRAIETAALVAGFDTLEAFNRVHASNMTKAWPSGEKIRKRADGKIEKPPTFVLPDLEDL